MASPSTEQGGGKIVTFYSYKGGTGRSMALAAVGWLLASNGQRVLMVDWDLEAPGLHRYFHPFLLDSGLRSSLGLMDLMWDFSLAAMTPDGEVPSTEEAVVDWYRPYADVLRYSISIDYAFEGGGRLDLVPAGRQDSAYATKVSSFDWGNFYDRLGGGAFLEAVKDAMRRDYDYVLIDSRTGLSDTAGICTVQMPDLLVCCFTLSTQSIEGSAAVATSVLRQRPETEFRILPVPMRVEDGEQRKLDAGRNYARSLFGSVLRDLTGEARDRYWAEVEVPYRRYYAYEEVLATIADRPHGEGTVLAALERLTSRLTDDAIGSLVPLPEAERIRLVTLFERGSQGGDSPDFFISYAAADGAWAEWIAWVLADAGYSVFVNAWDLQPGDNRRERIGTAIERSERVIAVISPAYLSSAFAEEELTTALRSDSRTTGRLIPILVADVFLPPLLDAIVSIDLRGRDEATSRQLLVSGAAAGGLRPTAAGSGTRAALPSFPGAGAPARREPISNLPSQEQTVRGRRDLLDTIADGFRRRSDGGRRRVVQVLLGLPGVGKTAAALEFAQNAGDEYDATWWAHGERWVEHVEQFAARLETDMVRDGRVLLVIDGVTSPNAVAMVDIPTLAMDVLITTRGGAWGKSGRVLRVEPLPISLAAWLLQETVEQVTMNDAEDLARAFGGLPAALILAAGYIRETGMSLRRYLELFAAHPVAVLERSHGDLLKTIRRTVQIAAVESEPAGELLEICAFLDVTHIPLDLFSPIPDLPPLLTQLTMNGLALEDAVQALSRQALLTSRPEGLTLQPLVQLVVRTELGAEANGKLRIALALLDYALRGDEAYPENWRRYADLTPHVTASTSHAERLADADLRGFGELNPQADVVALLLRVGQYLHLQAALPDARQALERCISLGQQLPSWSPYWPIRAERLLGDVQRLTGDLAAALAHLRTAIDLADGTSELPRTRCALATVMRDLGQILEAEAELQTALEECITSPMSPTERETELALIRRELGVVRGLAGRLDFAREDLEWAYAHHQSSLGSQNLEVARDLRELGAVLRDSGDMVGARSALERALRMQESVLGSEHPEVARDQRELGILTRRTGSPIAARTLLERAWRVQEAVFGSAHTEVARTRREVGAALREEGELAAARRAIEGALETQEAILGPDHPDLARTLIELSQTLLKVGEVSEARYSLERAQRILDRTFGEGNVLSTRVRENIQDLSEVVTVDETGRDELSDGL